MRTAFRYLIASKLSLFGWLAICIYLAPRSLTNNRGLSYCGYNWPTLVPFVGTLPLLMGAYCLSCRQPLQPDFTACVGRCQEQLR